MAVGEAHGLLPDPYVVLGQAAAATTTIKVGTAVAVPLRAPLLAASAMATLHALSGGRASFSLGRGDGAMKVLRRGPLKVAEFDAYVHDVQAYLQREDVELDEVVTSMSRIDDFDPSLALPPPTLNIAATGPRTIEVAARWADGISFSVGADVERLRNAIGLAHEACEKVGRDPASLTLGCYVQVAVTDDADASAREAIRGLVVTHARFSGFEARPVGDVEAADHERYRQAVETMEAVYRDHPRRRRAHRGRQAGRDRLLPTLGRRRRADRRVRDRRAGRLLRGAAAGDRRARDRADLHRHARGRRRPRRAERREDRARGPGGGAAMTALTGREVHLVAFPRGEVRESDFEVVEAPVGSVGPGQVLVRNTWTSVDPGLRLRLRERGPEGYFVAFPLRAPMDGIMTIGEVVESRADGFAEGDTVWHASGWRDYAVVTAGEEALRGLGTLRRLDVADTPPQSYLGLLGANGLTAYAGLLRVAGLREGDEVWVSAAAGSVGSIVAQLAKLRGHRVVGSAGSAEKVAYLLDELGLDAAFDYHDGPVAELLREAAPDGIDVYFDNVGGDHLEAAIGALRRGGRIAICGRSRSTTRPSLRRARATSSSSSPRTSRFAGSAARATATFSTRCSASSAPWCAAADCAGARPWSRASSTPPPLSRA